MSEGDILMAAGALAAIGTFIIPMGAAMATMDVPDTMKSRIWRWVIGIGIFLTIPFIWRVWVLAVVN